MAERKKKLEETAKLIRSRLNEFESRRVAEIDRPMHEVALAALRERLTDVGQQLSRLALAA